MEYHNTAKAALAKALEHAIKLTEIPDPDQVFCREVAEAERKRKDIQASYPSATRAERDIIHRECDEAEDAEAALREDWAKTGPQKKAQYNAQMEATYYMLMDHIAKVAEHVPDAELQKRFGVQWTLHPSSLSPPGSCFDEETTIGDAQQPPDNSAPDISNTEREVLPVPGASMSNSLTPDSDLRVPVPQHEIPFVESENPNGSVERDQKVRKTSSLVLYVVLFLTRFRASASEIIMMTTQQPRRAEERASGSQRSADIIVQARICATTNSQGSELIAKIRGTQEYCR